MSKGRYFCGGSALAVTLVLSLSATSAMAQQAPASGDTAPEVAEVITTGTYIRGAAEDAAIPVEVTSRADLQQQGEPTLTQMVRGMSEIGNTLQGDAGRSGGNVGETTLNLRNLGSNRTMNLMNGIRISSEVTGGTTNGDSQNIGQIPINAVQQIEQLKDGGAATYGSSAVAGVVNFRTRTDLNGLEAGASYEYIHGGSGDYSGDVQWGRRKDNNNILIDLSFSQVGQLRANARDFTKNQPLLLGTTPLGVGAGYSAQSNPGTYAFAAANGISSGATGAVITPIQPFATTLSSNGLSLLATSASLTGSTAGMVRDPLCNQLGGFRTFALTNGSSPNPACVTQYNQSENLISETNRYGVFVDTNFDINDNWRVNASVNFAKQVVPFAVTNGVTGVGSGTTAPNASPVAPCNPYDPSVVASVGRNCVAQGAPANGAAQVYYASGYNPAVYDFMRKAATNYGVGGGTPTSGATAAATPYFSSNQISQVVGCLPGQSATSAQCMAAGAAPGNVILNPRLWSPFSLGGVGVNDPMFHDGENTQRVENTYFRTQDSLKGSLGTIFGTDIDMTLQGAYTHHFYDVSGKGILVDRLQRALNGYGTDLDDHTGANGTVNRCTAAETYSSATGTPFSTGAGGGWDTHSGVTGAGDGCYFFNPFSSAVTQIKYGGGTAVAGSPTSYGFINTGNFQGYAPVNGVFTSATVANGAPGVGLTNANGIVNALFANRWSHLNQDSLDLQLIFNGTGGFNFKGGPLAWALGGEYRYDRRDQTYDTLSNRAINPCSFITNVNQSSLQGQANSALTDDVNVVGKNALNGGVENYTASCNEPTNALNPATSGPLVGTSTVAAQQLVSQTGVWMDGFGGYNYTRIEKDVAAFGELDIPLLDNVKLTAATRYERDQINSFNPAAAVVNAFNLSYQATKSLTFRASTGQTFQDVDCGTVGNIVQQCLAGLNTSTLQSGLTTGFITGTDNPTLSTNLNPNDRQDVYGNTALSPERGSNFSFGVVYKPTPNLLATLDLVNIKIVGTRVAPTNSIIPRLLVGESALGASITNADLAKNICSGAGAGLFTPGAASAVTGGNPLVQLIQTSGSKVGSTAQACAAGNTNNITLNGITAANGSGGTETNASYALLFSLPNFVNAGTTWTRQLDEHLEYTFPQQVLGGKFQASLDGTYILFFNQDPSSYNGVSLGPPVKYKGVYSNNNASETPSPFRGTIGLTWQSGKNTIHTDTHWASSVSDFSLGIPYGAVTSSIGTNYNPLPSKQACNAAVNTMAPDPRMTNKSSGVLGSPGFGEEGINVACNVGSFSGQVVPGWITTDVTYIRELPGKTTLSFNIDNIFDKDPPYQKLQPYYYAPYGTGNALGRTIKVSIHKAF